MHIVSTIALKIAIMCLSLIAKLLGGFVPLNKVKDLAVHLFLSWEKKRILWILDQDIAQLAIYHRRNPTDETITVQDDIDALEQLKLISTDHTGARPRFLLSVDGKRYMERYRKWFKERTWNLDLTA